MRLCERCKCTHRAFARHAAKRCFCHDHRVTERQRKQNVDQKGKCRRRILPQGTEIAKCCQDRPKRRPQTARTRAYPRTCCDYCDVSSLLLHLFSANIQTQPPVKPFFPFSFTGVLHQYVQHTTWAAKMQYLAFTNSFCVFCLYYALLSALRFFHPVKRHPAAGFEAAPAFIGTGAAAFFNDRIALRVCGSAPARHNSYPDPCGY